MPKNLVRQNLGCPSRRNARRRPCIDLHGPSPAGRRACTARISNARTARAHCPTQRSDNGGSGPLWYQRASDRTTRVDPVEDVFRRCHAGRHAKTRRPAVRCLPTRSKASRHVIAPELGIVLPGATHACADSHAPTVGALGALAFGCGTTELVHILADAGHGDGPTKIDAHSPRWRCLRRISCAKDVVLQHHWTTSASTPGAASRSNSPGRVIDHMPVEERFTLCNMATEMGAKTVCIAPDAAVLQWLAGRSFVPRGTTWERACQYWQTLRSRRRRRVRCGSRH